MKIDVANQVIAPKMSNVHSKVLHNSLFTYLIKFESLNILKDNPDFKEKGKGFRNCDAAADLRRFGGL